MESLTGCQSKSIEILYEDDCYIAFDKPPGLLVIPSPKKEKNTLTYLVNRQYAPPAGGYQLHPCHRLDRDTSGVILFAKGKKNQQLMMGEFFKRTVRKRYIALVQGRPPNSQGTIRSAILDYDGQRFSRKGRPQMAISHYRVIQFKKYYSIVEVVPVTGRTNQIRIHFSQMGNPLLGDRKYAEGKRFSVRFKRAALHASELEWRHPVYHRWRKVKSPLAKDMQELIHHHGSCTLLVCKADTAGLSPRRELNHDIFGGRRQSHDHRNQGTISQSTGTNLPPDCR